MSDYWVTGVAGFIGSRVAARLLKGGHQVVGVDNFNDSSDPRLKRWRVEQLDGPDFRLEQLDIRDRRALEHLRGQGDPPEAILHLAARAGVRFSVEDPWEYYATNLTGTLNLLQLCRDWGIRKFVLASTSSVYGEAAAAPFREEMPTDRPLSPYAASKKAAEELCHCYHYLDGIDVTVFRYFTVYGPAGRPDMSPFRFVQWIAEGRPVTVYGDGRQSRDFTFVDDVAQGTLLGLRPVGYQVFNLGNDSPVVLMDFIRLIEEKLGKKAELVFQPRHLGDVTRTWADISRAREELGWKPEASLSDGLDCSIEWYLRNRSWASRVVT